MPPGILDPPEGIVRAQALRHVERLVESNRCQNDSIGHRRELYPIGSVGIIGAGLMGVAIAAAHLRRNLPVVVTDSNETTLDNARDRIAQELATDLSIAESRRLVDWLVKPTPELAVVARCDLVLESIVETVVAKQQLYGRLEPLLGAGALLTTNTSTIPVRRLAERLRDPSRFCGLHFCHPVHQRPLVEIVRGAQTRPQAIASCVAHARNLEKIPVVVEDGPGFLVNRLLLPYLAEALEMVLEGVAVDQIERTATDFGMAKGPLHLLDEIGLDTVLHGGMILATAFPARTVASPLLVALVKAGRRGCKSGAGVFRYRQDATEPALPGLDAEATNLIARWARPRREQGREAIAARLFLPMVLEATRILEEGKASGPGDIDLTAIFALGFPNWRGGLLRWADSLGAARVVELLKSLAWLGPRVQPTPMLLDQAQSGGRFFTH